MLEPGKEKLSDEWKTLWSQWDECIEESGREEGNYIYQEEHWEPPCLDQDRVMQDIEQIAKRMRELLARVWHESRAGTTAPGVIVALDTTTATADT